MTIALKENERHAVLFNVKVDDLPDDLDVGTRSLTEAMELVKRMFDEDKADMTFAEARAEDGDSPEASDAAAARARPTLITILDMAVDKRNHRATILLGSSNRELSDPGFMNTRTKRSRIEKKKRGEGIAVSAHLTFSLHGSAASPTLYRATLEQVPGLSRAAVIPYLNRLIRRACNEDEAYRHEKPGTSSLRKFWLKLVTSVEPNQKLMRDIEEGNISGVDLIRNDPTNVGVIDGASFLKPEEYRLKISVERANAPTGNRLKDILNGIIRRGITEGFDRAQIHVRDSVAKTSKSLPTIEAVNADISDLWYGRVETLSGFTGLTQLSTAIREDVRDGLFGLLAKDSLWR